MKKEKREFIEKHKTNPEALTGFTRRELLEAGAITLFSRLLVPSSVATLSQALFSSESHAQTMMAQVPMITFNLAGGASIHGNIVAKDKGGLLLPSYDKLGLGKAPEIENYLGLPFDKRSRLLEGLKSVLSPAAAARTKGLVLCTNTNIDTNGVVPLRPQYDISAAIESAGLRGKYFSDLQLNTSLGSLRSFHENDPVSRLEIKSREEVLDSLSLTAVYASAVSAADTTPRFSKTQKSRMANLIGKIAEQQFSKQSSDKYQASGGPITQATKQLEDIVGGNVSGRDLVDPFKSSPATTVFDLGNKPTVETQTIASICHCSLMGYASHGLIVLGNYDYHAPLSRIQSDQKDFEAGKRLGQIFQLAHVMQKPLFVFVATDGSNYSEISDTNLSGWSGDTTTSMQLLLSYHPTATIESVKSQVGAYLPDQSVDKNTLVGDRSDYVASAVIANYLSMNDMLPQFASIAPATITTARLSEVIGLRKKAA
ncbi:hypothetical protein [Bdellovibrio sp. HCB337]|uniref:hypothetical protein n=1 Tax=Bdellovibrio sp. HCB337 TaxID=3394358 RepID=UPI0039A77FC3